MKIDNRFFILPAAPFILGGIIRLFFAVFGVDWALDAFGAILILICGITLGVFVSAVVFAEDVDLGHVTLFGGKGD